ncbi:MAG: CooT family nickel-binding protein [Deltaproteobacteria bacterium]|jgi:predicted RNA-binding protein|nr:CooT family nickel-binding protein [Deltaproteobacteria bacterium]
MCEANIYIEKNGSDDEEPELFLAAANEVIPEEENVWRVTSIFGEQKILRGRIKSMHLVDHMIVFTRDDSPEKPA